MFPAKSPPLCVYKSGTSPACQRFVGRQGRGIVSCARFFSRFPIILFISLSLLMPPRAASSAGESHRSADMILAHGLIYTMDASRSWVQSLAIMEGRIVYAGTDSGAHAFIGPSTQVLDLKGNMVLPGFHDSHCHPIMGGYEAGKCSLFGLDTREKLYDAITAYRSAHPGEKWITGSGWDTPLFTGGSPKKGDLDRLIPDRPACLTSADGHSAWVNSKALTLAGITAGTPDPPGGHIERDGESGAPSGTLRESAVQLVTKCMPPVKKETYMEGILRALKLAHRFGITSIIEATADEEVLECYHELDRKGLVTAKIRLGQRVDPLKGEGQVDTFLSRKARYASPRIDASSVKIYVDGVMESHTAALLAPYLDRKDDCGSLLVDPAQLSLLVTAFDLKGFQVHVHAIGDRAIRSTLDAIEQALLTNGNRDNRHTIAHLELIDPLDIPRFRTLGVIANFQPYWCSPDIYIREMTIPILGPERTRWLYPIESVVQSGALVAAGSDWPVSSLNPLDAIEVAITRRAPGETGSDALCEDERIGLMEALAAYTIHGAYLRHQENMTGSLENGKAADLVVLDHNLFDMKPQEIHTARVLMTMVDGKAVFGGDYLERACRKRSGASAGLHLP